MSKIGFTIEADGAAKTAQDIAEIKFELTEVNKELRKAKKDKDKAGFIRLTKQAEELRKKQTELRREWKASQATFTDLINKFRVGGVSVGEFKGGLVQANGVLKVSRKAILGNASALRIFAVALGATGIGLILVALGSLIAYLTQTQKGIDLVNRALASFKSIIATVIDAFARFKTEGFAAFNGLGKNIVDNVKATDKMVKGTQALVQERRALAVETERVRTREKELSKIAEDTSASAEERSKAAAEGIRIEQELLAKREDFAKRNLEFIKEEVRLKGELAKNEDLDKIAAAEIELANIREESVERQTTLNSKLNVSNQALAKQIGDIAKGPMEAFRSKIKDIEELVNSGTLDEAGLTAKIKEMLALQAEIDKMEEKIRSISEQVSRGETPGEVVPLDTLDISGGIEFDPRIPREKQVLEELFELRKKANSEAHKQELDRQKQERKALEEFQNDRIAIIADASSQIGNIVGELFSGQIKTFQEFEEALLGTLLDSVEKAINLLIPQIFAQLIATNPVLGTTLAGAAAGLIKGLFAGAKAGIKKRERGGILDGPSHVHGGVPLGNGDEGEGGEAIINKRSTAKHRVLLSAINSDNNWGKKFARGGIRVSNNIPNFVGPGASASSNFNGGPSTAYLAEESIGTMTQSIADAVREAIGLGIDDSSRQQERRNIGRKTSVV